MKIFIGIAVFIIGLLSLIFAKAEFSLFTYSFLWWGLLLLIDNINLRRWGSSPISQNSKSFWLVIVPLSIIYWLYFEFANFYFLQWSYIVPSENTGLFLASTAIAFATVIPAVIEFTWLFIGSIPNFAINRKYALTMIVFGILFLALPFFSQQFLLNQLMWIAPFLIFIPFIKGNQLFTNKILFQIAIAGLITGIFWEGMNFWSATKWQYLILLNLPHLFEMPLPGYLGFIPFAFSTFAIYLLAMKFIKPDWRISIILYFLGLTLTYRFVILALAKGII